MKKFDLFIFDLGKVLIDFDFNIAIRRLNSISPLNLNKVMALFMNSQLAKDWDRGILEPEEFFKTIKKELNLPIEIAEFIPIWNSIFTPNEEMIAMALRLAQKKQTVLLSNTNPWHFQYIKQSFSWLKNFQELIASCEVRMLKPDPEIFHYTLRKRGVVPERALYIDDIPENVSSALKLGIDSIQFKSYPLLLEELKLRAESIEG